jgi:hypothetical protein
MLLSYFADGETEVLKEPQRGRRRIQSNEALLPPVWGALRKEASPHCKGRGEGVQRVLDTVSHLALWL